MTAAPHRSAASGSACAGIALGLVVLTAATDVAADGDETPMLGGALVGARGPDPRTDIVGVALEAGWWSGRFGLALEGAALWNLDGDEARALVLGASARVRVLERLMPSLLEPRDVELGVELHAIVERAWWNGDHENPTGHGLGLAVRLRGGSDDFPTLFTESRLFVRAVSSHRTVVEDAARTMTPGEAGVREWTILVGIGAAFGSAGPRYLDRFRLHPLELPLGR
jgi:hypothetical protein